MSRKDFVGTIDLPVKNQKTVRIESNGLLIKNFRTLDFFDFSAIAIGYDGIIETIDEHTKYVAFYLYELKKTLYLPFGVTSIGTTKPVTIYFDKEFSGTLRYDTFKTENTSQLYLKMIKNIEEFKKLNGTSLLILQRHKTEQTDIRNFDIEIETEKEKISKEPDRIIKREIRFQHYVYDIQEFDKSDTVTIRFNSEDIFKFFRRVYVLIEII